MRPTPARVVQLTPTSDGTRLNLANGSEIRVPGSADIDAAQRFRVVARRVDRIDLVATASGVRCEATVTSRRAQRHRRIPLRIGLGLIRTGTAGFVSMH